MATIDKLQKWQRDIVVLSVLYHMLEKGKRFDTRIEVEGRRDTAFAQPYVDYMFKKGLLEIKGIEYVVTQKGRDVMRQVVAMFDLSEKFAIFGDVDIDADLPPEICPEDPDNAGLVNDDAWDPRFKSENSSPTQVFTDMRIPMMSFVTTEDQMKEKLGGKSIDLHRIVFAQKLKDGELATKDFWYHLRDGSFFAQIDHIVRNQTDWMKLGKPGEDPVAIMNTLYKAGMLEQLKRNGQMCSACKAPLGTFEMWSQRNDQKSLEECPCCSESFVSKQVASTAPPVTITVCPDCGCVIAPNHRKCHGCGAHIRRSLPPGTVETETIEEIETVDEVVTFVQTPYGYSYYDPYCYGYADPFWSVSYGYEPPIVYLDPFNPVVDAFAFGVLCGVLL